MLDSLVKRFDSSGVEWPGRVTASQGKHHEHDTRHHVHALIDQLPPKQLAALETILQSMLDPLSRKFALAPFDDEPFTEADGRRGRSQALAERRSAALAHAHATQRSAIEESVFGVWGEGKEACEAFAA